MTAVAISTAHSARAIQEVLLRSKRRCALCFLAGKEEPREGVVARIVGGQDPEDPDNLVFLCLEHHQNLDVVSHPPTEELKRARAALYDAMDHSVAGQTGHSTPWRAYEELVARLITNELSQSLGGRCVFRRNSIYPGRSGLSREVDLAIEFEVGRLQFLTICEIKLRKAPLDAREVMLLASKVEDIGANKGILVGSAGFSKAAFDVAARNGLALFEVSEQATRLGPVASTNKPSLESLSSTHNIRMSETARSLLKALLKIQRRAKDRPPSEALISYKNLFELAGMNFNRRWAGKQLFEIHEWCRLNGWPPLNALVVNSQLGRPGANYPGESWEMDVHDVLAFAYPRDATSPP